MAGQQQRQLEDACIPEFTPKYCSNLTIAIYDVSRSPSDICARGNFAGCHIQAKVAHSYIMITTSKHAQFNSPHCLDRDVAASSMHAAPLHRYELAFAAFFSLPL